MEDREQLIDDETRPGRNMLGRLSSCVASHKRLLLFLVVLSLILAGHAIAIYYIYFRCSEPNCFPLKVMSLNCWGMPASLGSEFKQERINGIATRLGQAEYDIYLFQELWMEPDYYTIRDKLPKGYYMTEFRGLALSTCDGRALPSFCSGLSIASRFPFEDVEFNSFTLHGDPVKTFIDGEWMARKGVGRVRIKPSPNVTVDVFVTHTAADPDPSYEYTNEYYRRAQVKELIDSYIKKSDADVVLLGGDFNAGPETTPGSPYSTVRQVMTNSVEEIFYKLQEWLNVKFATYGNLENTFSGHKYAPIIYDYIFFKTNRNKTSVYTSLFELPLFKMTIFPNLESTNQTSPQTPSEQDEQEHARNKREVKAVPKKISLSDHEAITSTIYVQYN